MANETDIAQIISMISAAHPNFSPSELTTEVYYQTLRDLEMDELKAAVLVCITEAGRKFAPSVGEIRGAVMELRRAALNIPSPYEAWDSFLKYVIDGRPMHPLAEKTMKLLGEMNLRMSENQTSDRMRFIECYEQLVKRTEKENMLLPEVRGYLEVNGAKMLAPLDQIKQLSEGMRK